MSLDATVSLAREGRLYPSVILHGGDEASRRGAALGLARALLCDLEPGERGREDPPCRHCRRLAWGASEGAPFHPDFLVLERDLRTATSAGATRELLQAVRLSPFEARGQVFVLASAESLTGEAADALLKALEEPPTGAPRHFLLLAPSQLDLAPTLRSRSLAVYLGSGAEPLAGALGDVADRVAGCVAAYAAGGSPVWLLSLARALASTGGWEDPRAERPWSLAAAAALDASRRLEAGSLGRRSLLALADELLTASQWRLRGIPAERILEGLVARHLAGGAGSS